jgi:transposase-like protein
MEDGLEHVIVSLYAKGLTVSDIKEKIREAYNFQVSTSTISKITNAVASDIFAWQNRLLEPVYLLMWMESLLKFERSVSVSFPKVLQ